MRVLITNDDGIESEGLHALVRAFAPIHEVVVLAPSDDRSASSAALTVRSDIDVHAAPALLRMGAALAYHLNGTPATCVVLAACGTVVPRPDLVVSGVNPGPNLGCDVYLSGTVGAARVATTLGIPGVAASCRRDPAAPAWETAARMALRTVELLGDGHLDAGGIGGRPPLVNINVPSLTPRSVVATTVAGYHIVEHTVVEQAAPPGNAGRRLRLELRAGVPPSLEPGTDAWAFFAGDTSVTVLDHPADRPAPDDPSDLACYLARHLVEEVSGARNSR